MLRDRLVCGINDARLQRRLLAESTLTFEKALSVALAWESAERNARHLQLPTAVGETVHAIGQGRHRNEEARRQSEECFRCGGRKAQRRELQLQEYRVFQLWEKGTLGAHVPSSREESDGQRHARTRTLAG